MQKSLLAVLAAAALAVGSVAAQSPAAGGAWQVPRTPDGHPDLQGIWANNGVTPMARPTQWKDKAQLTDEELRDLQQLVARYVDQGGDAIFGEGYIQKALDLKDTGTYDQTSGDASTGNYNNFWIAEREWDNRTSLIVDPPDGQFPPMTPEARARFEATAQERQARSESGPAGRADGPEDRPLNERCITYGAPYTLPAYDSYFQIVQSPATVAIVQEMIHDARMVPIGSRTPQHLPSGVRAWNGDPRGWWDGDTLVVETTNYREGLRGYAGEFQGTSPDARVTERYTRVGPDMLNWEITVDDPATWTRPWTFMIRLKRSTDQLYEYACHEGNYALRGILAGARAKEAGNASSQQQ